MQRTRLSSFVLAFGLAFVFGYFGIDKFVHPELWLGWMPLWIDGFLGLTPEIWLSIIGFIEFAIAVLLIIPVRRVQQTGAVLAALHLIAIISQVGWNDIGVRDIGLLLSSISLLILL